MARADGYAYALVALRALLFVATIKLIHLNLRLKRTENILCASLVPFKASIVFFGILLFISIIHLALRFKSDYTDSNYLAQRMLIDVDYMLSSTIALLLLLSLVQMTIDIRLRKTMVPSTYESIRTAFQIIAAVLVALVIANTGMAMANEIIYERSWSGSRGRDIIIPWQIIINITGAIDISTFSLTVLLMVLSIATLIKLKDKSVASKRVSRPSCRI